MNNSELIRNEISEININELIFANSFYRGKKRKYSENTFYKNLERMVKDQTLNKLSKGVYYRSKTNKFGASVPSETEIINTFTKNNGGMVIGYQLYNQLGLTTQISKNIQMYSTSIKEETKNIRNVTIIKCNLNFTPKMRQDIAFLEVLANLNNIEDINYKAYKNYCREFANSYKGFSNFEKIFKEIKYKKRTLAQLKDVLDYFQIKNNLASQLSTLSKYEYTSMEKVSKLVQNQD